MEIKDFDEFFDGLIESFNSPLPIKWVDKKNALIGLFTINGQVYQINCLEKGNNIWTFKFYLFDPIKNTMSPELTKFNKGSMSILSTIKIAMEYLIKTKNPNALIFGALDKSEARKKLYYLYSNELGKEYGFTFFTKVEKEKQIFVLFKDIDKEALFNTIQTIIEETLNEI